MRKHKKLFLNLIVLVILVVFLAGINGIRLSAKSAALQVGYSQYFDQAVASILAYEGDHALVMIKQKEDASCFVVKKELGILWRATAYGSSSMNIAEAEGEESLKQACFYLLSLASNTIKNDVMTPIQYMDVLDLNLDGKIYPLYEITSRELQEYHRIQNDFFASSKSFNDYVESEMNNLWVLNANGQSSLRLLDPRQANTTVYFGEEGFNIYFTSQVNPNRNMTIQDVYLESQFILDEFMKTVESYETIDEFDVMGVDSMQAIIEDIIDENDLNLEFGSITLDRIQLVSPSNTQTSRDIEEYAKQMGWAIIRTEFKVHELAKMTRNDIFRLLNIPNRDVLIHAQDDQYLRFLKTDRLPLITEKIDETSIFIGFDFNAEDELKKILESTNHQDRFTQIIIENYSSIQNEIDLFSYQERLINAIAQEFDMDPSIFDVAMVSQFPYQ